MLFRRTVDAALFFILSAALAPLEAQDRTELVRTLQVHLDSLTEHSAFPGLTLGVALADGSSLGFAAGWSDTIAHREMRPEDRMLQGSVGKTYFGAIALQLAADGRLHLDSKLSDYLGNEPWYGGLPRSGSRTSTAWRRLSRPGKAGIIRTPILSSLLWPWNPSLVVPYMTTSGETSSTRSAL